MIQALETKYAGYRFRSRLEARWAVFFDAQRIDYLFEPQGFKLSNGESYLPDFYLPRHKLWVEIKGSTPTEAEYRRAALLRSDSETPVYVVEGLPNRKAGMLFAWESFYGNLGLASVTALVQFNEQTYIAWQPGRFSQLQVNPRIPQAAYIACYSGMPDLPQETAASLARFEHGEKP